MKDSNPPTTEHQDIWDLLPWLVNGRLSEADRGRVEAHLRVCGPCRDEFATQHRLCQVIATDAAVEQMPVAGLSKLRQRIDSYERASAPARAESPPDSPAISRAWARIPAVRRQPRGAIAASAVCIAVVFGVVAAQLWNRSQVRGGAASYHTVTTPTSQEGNAVIRAVFAPTVTLSELQALLDDAHLRIVSGPTEAGVYSLAMTGSQPMDWSLHRLRGHDTVRFAEAIAPPSGPSRPP
jgi:anti-sigma factor RsiW